MTYLSTAIKKARYLVARDSDQVLILEKNDGAFVDIVLDTQVSRDAAISAAINNLLAGVPGALDTLNELATALGDDANFAATVTTALGNRLAWRGAWAASTSYVLNDLVLFNGGLYVAPANFTSGVSFVKANWTELVPQIGTYVPLRGTGAGQIIYVTPTGDDANTGTAPGAAKASLASAKSALAGGQGRIVVWGTITPTAVDANNNLLTLDQVGMSVEGLGMGLSRVLPGVDATWGIECKAAQCEVKDLEVIVLAGHTVTYGVGVSSTTSAQSCSFRNVLVHSSGGGVLTNGFGVSPDGHADIAETIFINCLAKGYVNAGWLIGDDVASNVLNTRMFGCIASSGTYGVKALGTGFSWYGGTTQGNTGADFYVGSPASGPISIEGIRSENSKRLLDSEGPTGAIQNVSLRSIIYNAGQMNADGKFINWLQSGSLTLDGISVKNSGAVVPQIAVNSNYSIAVATRGLTMAARVDLAVNDLGAAGALVLSHQGYTQTTGADAFVTSVSSYSNGTKAIYGDGTDGALVVANGVTTIVSADRYYSKVTVQSGGTLVTAGYRIKCQGIFDIQAGGVVHNDGATAVADVAGAAAPSGTVGPGRGGTAGGTGAGSQPTALSSSFGGAGGAGGTGAGGAGGAAGGVTNPAVNVGKMRSLTEVSSGHTLGNGAVAAINGGGGGGAGGGDATNKGGGGGGGGGPLLIAAKVLNVDGTLRSAGGAGGNAVLGNCGGGGGGGGGELFLIYDIKSGANKTLTAAVNTPGGAAGAHTGTAADGAAGSNGTIRELVNQ